MGNNEKEIWMTEGCIGEMTVSLANPSTCEIRIDPISPFKVVLKDVKCVLIVKAETYAKIIEGGQTVELEGTDPSEVATLLKAASVWHKVSYECANLLAALKTSRQKIRFGFDKDLHLVNVHLS